MPTTPLRSSRKPQAAEPLDDNGYAVPREFLLTDADFEYIQEVARRHTGIALAENKRNLVYSRLSRRLRRLGLSTFTDYCRLLEDEKSPERQDFINAITTNLTSFFREEHHFKNLTQTVLPMAVARNAATRRLRIWSAGCSTGEEPYSIAMVLREAWESLRGWDVRILATDLDSNVLATAQAGRYSMERLRGVSPTRCQRWFHAAPRGEMRVDPEVARLVTFRQLNLVERWPMRGPLDIIFCRNVIIYFDKPTQRTLFDRMAALQPAGAHLFVGHSENLTRITERYRLLSKTTYERVAN
jgi:chemotaxis protein methyltransferase CheR